MKTKLKNLLPVYKAFGEAKVTTLGDSEVLKVIKARKSMRKHVKDYEDFLEDVKEKMKPEGFDKKMAKAQEWDKLPEPERAELNRLAGEYRKRMDDACNPELEKEVEIEFEPLSDDSVMKIVKENGWPTGRADELDID